MELKNKERIKALKVRLTEVLSPPDDEGNMAVSAVRLDTGEEVEIRGFMLGDKPVCWSVKGWENPDGSIECICMNLLRNGSSPDEIMDEFGLSEPAFKRLVLGRPEPEDFWRQVYSNAPAEARYEPVRQVVLAQRFYNLGRLWIAKNMADADTVMAIHRKYGNNAGLLSSYTLVEDGYLSYADVCKEQRPRTPEEDTRAKICDFCYSNVRQGDTCTDWDELLSRFPGQEGLISQLLSEEKIIREGGIVYTPGMKEAEDSIREWLAGIENSEPDPELTGRIEDLIFEFEQSKGFSLSDEQAQMVVNNATHKVCVNKGGPGTGKTTVSGAVFHVLSMLGCSIIAAAPTGKAAKRLAESTGLSAVTISGLCKQCYGGGFAIGEGEITADVLFVDEASMIDTPMMAAIVKGLSPSTKLILSGDCDQLPAVGPGDILRDLMVHPNVCTSQITKTFRQDKGSKIIDVAHQVNRGEELSFPDSWDVYHADVPQEKIADEVVSIYKASLEEGFPDEKIMIVTPIRKDSYDTGSICLNERIIEANEEMRSRPSVSVRTRSGQKTFYEGMKILVTKNFEKAVNGESGKIKEITEAGDAVISFPGGEKTFTKHELAQYVNYGYAISVHASQGSQAPVVIVVCDPTHKNFSRKMLYTAITRSEQFLFLVGESSAISYAINNTGHERRTNLL